MNAAPSGIGFYCRQLGVDTHGTPAQLAKRLKDVGATWVAFMAVWQDKSGPGKSFANKAAPRDRTKAYADACRNAGIDVWLWGFPHLGHEELYVEAMRSMSAAISGGVRGWLHDTEVSYRDRNARVADLRSRGQGEAIDAQPEGDAMSTARRAQVLLELDAKARAELRLAPSGISSYGMAAWHALPWRQLAGDGTYWGSPQLYTVTPKQVDQGLASWRDRGFSTLIPSVPTYGPNSGSALDAHLGHFVDGNEPDIRGFVFWSFQQTSGVEWKTIKRWSEHLRARACVAPTPIVP